MAAESNLTAQDFQIDIEGWRSSTLTAERRERLSHQDEQITRITSQILTD